MMDINTIKKKLSEFIKDVARNTSFNNNTDLIEESIIDSLNFVELILYMEKQFNFKVKLFEFNISKYNSINSLADFVIKQNMGKK